MSKTTNGRYVRRQFGRVDQSKEMCLYEVKEYVTDFISNLLVLNKIFFSLRKLMQDGKF